MGVGNRARTVRPGRPTFRPSLQAPTLALFLAAILLAGAAVWAGGQPQGPSDTAAPIETPLSTATPALTPTGAPTAIPLPADIAGKVWLVDRAELYLSPPLQGFVGGTLDGSIHEVFPIDWKALAFDGSRVVTVEEASGTLTVSDRVTRGAVMSVPTGLNIQQVTLTPEAIYWTGAAKDGMQDGGVWIQRLDGSAPRVLVSAGPYPEGFSGPPIGRTRLLVSPSGKVVATSLCDTIHCLPTVIDTDAGGETLVDSARFAQDGFVATAGYVTDDLVLVFESPANDLPPRALAAFDRLTLKERWRISAAFIFPGCCYPTSDGLSLIQALQEQADDGDHYRLEQVALSDGSRTLLWSYLFGQAPTRWARGDLSSNRYVVLLPAPDLVGALIAGKVNYDVLDLTTGSLAEAAGSIDALGD